jgi:hypothetical protein
MWGYDGPIAEHVQVATQIMTSCMLLGGVAFLQLYGTLLVRLLCNLLASIAHKGLPLLFPVLEGMLQISPAEAPHLLDPCLQQLFIQTLSASDTTDIHTGQSSHILTSDLTSPLISSFVQLLTPMTCLRDISVWTTKIKC